MLAATSSNSSRAMTTAVMATEVTATASREALADMAIKRLKTVDRSKTAYARTRLNKTEQSEG